MRLITEKMDTLKNQRDRSRALEEHISDQKEKLDLKKKTENSLLEQQQLLKEEQEQNKDAAGQEIAYEKEVKEIRQKIQDLTEIAEQLNTSEREVKRLGTELENVQKSYEVKSRDLQQQKETWEQLRCRQQGRTGRESNIGSIREDTQARRAGKQVRGL